MKLTSNVLLGGLAACILTLPLMASSVTYTYTGNDFTINTFPYTTSDSVSGYFTLATALGDGLSDVAISPVTYSFTDGVQTFTNAAPPSTVTFDVSTSATGAITEWYILLQNPYAPGQTYDVETADGLAETRDFGEFPEGAGVGQGVILFDPGTWVQSGGGTSPTPEPGYLGLIALGLVGIGVVRRKMQRQSQPVS